MKELIEETIRDRIHVIRGLHVMLDEDLAKLYDVEIKVLNQAVKRNIIRFPDNFMFKLTVEEYNSLRFQDDTLNVTNLRSQIVTLNKKNLKSQIATSSSEILKSQIVTSNNGHGEHRKYLPYAFTEQGVAMLSSVLRSETAVRISIQIMNAFVDMRRLIVSNAGMFQRLDKVEQKQLEYDKKFEQVFDAIENRDLKPDKGIFYDGPVFDAYELVAKIIRSATRSIVLIDNYVDETVLTLFSKRRKNVNVTIYTKVTKELLLDVAKYNAQYPNISVCKFNKSHDRFILIDDTIVYHLGASLKDLGRKWFAFSRFDKEAVKILGIFKNN